jgi:hypothetical protein
MEPAMPRYLVERTFTGESDVLAGSAVIDANAKVGVTWLNSLVTPDRHRSYCICDGPSPEAIRMAARTNGLPVDRITEVHTLTPCAVG